MGQQQLLLLVLGIVIVGLAVVVGIQAFGENQSKANADALVNDGVRLASDAQAWKLKPQAFGGGADAAGFTGLSLAQLGYDNPYSNLNGTWTSTVTSVTVNGTTEANGFQIVGCSEDNDNQVTVNVAGTTSELISTAVVTGSDCTETSS